MKIILILYCFHDRITLHKFHISKWLPRHVLAASTMTMSIGLGGGGLGLSHQYKGGVQVTYSWGMECWVATNHINEDGELMAAALCFGHIYSKYHGGAVGLGLCHINAREEYCLTVIARNTRYR